MRVCISEAVALILSVLNMLWRDVKKLVTSLMRMLMYFSPVIWECHFSDNVPYHDTLNFIMKLNPLYYIINGYRDSIFYGTGFWQRPALTLYFWAATLILFCSRMHADVQVQAEVHRSDIMRTGL